MKLNGNCQLEQLLMWVVRKSKHSKLPKGMPKLRRRTAADALKISNNNDPVYNLKQMFESKASRRTFEEAGMGLQGRNFYYSSSRLPLPGSLGKIDNTPMLTLNNLGRNSMFMDLQRASKRLPPKPAPPPKPPSIVSDGDMRDVFATCYYFGISYHTYICVYMLYYVTLYIYI